MPGSVVAVKSGGGGSASESMSAQSGHSGPVMVLALAPRRLVMAPLRPPAIYVTSFLVHAFLSFSDVSQQPAMFTKISITKSEALWRPSCR